MKTITKKSTTKPTRKPRPTATRAKPMPPETVFHMQNLLQLLDGVAESARRLRADPACTFDIDDLRAVEYISDRIGGLMETYAPIAVITMLERERGSVYGEYLHHIQTGEPAPADLGRRLRAWLDGEELAAGRQPAEGEGEAA